MASPHHYWPCWSPASRFTSSLDDNTGSRVAPTKGTGEGPLPCSALTISSRVALPKESHASAATARRLIALSPPFISGKVRL